MVSYYETRYDRKPFIGVVLISLAIHFLVLSVLARTGPGKPVPPPVQVIFVDVKPLNIPHIQSPERDTARLPRTSRSPVRLEPVIKPLSELETKAVQEKTVPVLPKISEMQNAVPVWHSERVLHGTVPPDALMPVTPLAAETISKRQIQDVSEASVQDTVTSHVRSSANSEYLALLRNIIDRHKEYPLMARRGRMEGTVLIRFTLSREGTLKKTAVIGSCGRTLLDRAAEQAITIIGKFPPVPETIQGNEIALEVPVTYKLSGK